MKKIEFIVPFKGVRAAANYGDAMLSPPYDVVNRAEALAHATQHPHSFFHITRPEIDLANDVDPYSAAVYQQGQQTLQRWLQEKKLIVEDHCAFYIYRLAYQDHVQTGLLCLVSTESYRANRVKKHELTRAVKEQDRINHINTLAAQTGPVILCHKPDVDCRQLLAKLTEVAPILTVTDDSGVTHSLWVVKDDPAISQLRQHYNQLPELYIADGHHRCAAASQVATQLENKCDDPIACGQYILSVVFATDELKILSYNRVIKDLNSLTTAEFLQALSHHFTITAESQAVQPAQPGQFGLYLAKQWYRLTLNPNTQWQTLPASDRLDVALLANYVLEPLLFITEPRTDPRIDFVGGSRGLLELERRVDSGEMALAFAMYPTPINALLEIADHNEIMPPKSTWFEPKLADGLVSYVFEKA